MLSVNRLDMNEITPIPGKTWVIVGSCPKCGIVIFDRDLVVIDSVRNTPIYRCLTCKQEYNDNELIPF